jgi:hypothetical protein
MTVIRAMVQASSVRVLNSNEVEQAGATWERSKIVKSGEWCGLPVVMAGHEAEAELLAGLVALHTISAHRKG